ncbi:multicomponent Na+:H+ antiporter subunit F [Rhizobium aquaticum]|uniref:Multicomponent Na+:H+ antiporter subunit F n=1 Tax=Rhizobium aquaticum TaxID=1549636 RepID=A0ABV2J099_9HYPH
MTAGDQILELSIWFALVALPIAFLMTVVRVMAGPSLPDRVVALDMLVAIAIGFLAVVALKTGFHLYIDIAMALGLVGFLATIAFARFLLATAGKAKAGVPKESVAKKGKVKSESVTGRRKT